LHKFDTAAGVAFAEGGNHRVSVFRFRQQLRQGACAHRGGAREYQSLGNPD